MSIKGRLDIAVCLSRYTKTSLYTAQKSRRDAQGGFLLLAHRPTFVNGIGLGSRPGGGVKNMGVAGFVAMGYNSLYSNSGECDG
jgi:hypothetical protein